MQVGTYVHDCAHRPYTSNNHNSSRVIFNELKFTPYKKKKTILSNAFLLTVHAIKMRRY